MAYEKNKQELVNSAEAVRRAQEEIRGLGLEEADRARVVALLNNVTEALTRVSDSLVEDPDLSNDADKPAERVVEDAPRPGKRR